jgi:hypothetical protein
MKKVSSVAGQASRKISAQKLTVGLDLGDLCSWYCVLDEAGSVLLEQKLSTTARALQAVFGSLPRSRIALETGLLIPSDFVNHHHSQEATDTIGLRMRRGTLAWIRHLRFLFAHRELALLTVSRQRR